MQFEHTIEEHQIFNMKRKEGKKKKEMEEEGRRTPEEARAVDRVDEGAEHVGAEQTGGSEWVAHLEQNVRIIVLVRRLALFY